MPTTKELKKFVQFGTQDPVQVESAIRDGNGKKINEEYLGHNDYDGTSGVGFADNAYQLYSTIRLADNAPYNYRTSGGVNDIGDRVSLKKLVGSSIAIAQRLRHSNISTTTQNGITVTKNADNSITVNGTATDDVSILLGGTTKVSPSAKVLISVSKDAVDFSFIDTWTGRSSKTNQRYTASSNGNIDLKIRVASGTTVNNETMLVQIFDLTTTFNPTIADHLSTLTIDQALAKIKPWINPDKYYEYSATPKLLSTKASKKINTEVNLFDKSTYEYGTSTYDGRTCIVANETSSSGRKIISNQAYLGLGQINITFYVRTTTTVKGRMYFAYDDGTSDEFTDLGNNTGWTKVVKQSNANKRLTRIRVGNASNGTSNAVYFDIDSITINLSHNGSKNGTYFPYKKHEYDLPNEVLRGMLVLDSNNNIIADGDYITPDGTLNEEYGVVKLKELNWIKRSTGADPNYTYVFVVENPTFDALFNNQQNFSSTIYDFAESNAIYLLQKDKVISLFTQSTYKYIWVRDTSFDNKTADEFKNHFTDNDFIIYKKATPTTRQVSPYQETQIVNDWSTEEIICKGYDESTQTLTEIDLPCGHESEYWDNLHDKLQNLPNKAQNEGDYLVHQNASGVQSYKAISEGMQPFINYVDDLVSLVTDQYGKSIIECSSASDTPYGVTWTKDGQSITGTLAASYNTKTGIYLVKVSDDENNNFDEYITTSRLSGDVMIFEWEKLGSTSIDPSSIVPKNTIVPIKNRVTNINGYYVEGYSATELRTDESNKDYYILKKNDVDVTNVEVIKTYYRYMTGDDHLPTFNFTQPNSVLFVDPNFDITKPVYTGTELRLYLVNKINSLPTTSGLDSTKKYITEFSDGTIKWSETNSILTGLIRYDASQSLTTVQKAQARNNIGVSIQSDEPTSAISDGGIHIVILDEEPDTKYDGYIYMIKEA